MSPTTTTTAEHFTIEGPFGPAIAIGIGLILALLFAGSLRRESNVLGSKTALLFWCLRTTAIFVVLWMLLAPTKRLVETSRTRRAIVFATDISGSMLTIDPPNPAEDLRWEMTHRDMESFSFTREADRIAAALGVALKQMRRANEQFRLHSDEHRAIDFITSAYSGIERAQEHTQRIASTSLARPFSQEVQILSDRLTTSFSGAEIRAFAQTVNAIKTNRTPPQHDLREGFEDLEHRISTMAKVAQELAWRVAEEEGKQFQNAKRAKAPSVPSETRLSRVTSSFAFFEQVLATALREKADFQFGSFDQSMPSLSGEPAFENTARTSKAADQELAIVANRTDLSAVFTTLQREAARQPLAAVFLISDFAHNQPGTDPLELARALNDIPIYVVPIGNTQHVRDVQLRSVFAPTVAMRNDDIIVEASLQAFHCDGEVCVVHLIQDGVTIDQREIVLDSGLATRTVRFEHHVGTLGTEHLRLAIVPIEGELTADNNARDFEVNVTRNDIKLLIADEFPRWEYRYLTQLFRRDSKVECDELLFHPRVSATGRREESKAVPLTIDEWNYYDVVVMGDIASHHFPVVAQETLLKYLQDRGGTVVMIAGSESMPQAYANLPLGEIVPVEPIEGGTVPNREGYEIQITAEGSSHPALMIGETEAEHRSAWDLVNHYSPLSAVSAWRKPKAAAKTLIASVPRKAGVGTTDEKESAFLCWQQVGRGRIIYFSAPESFRLRFLRGDRLHYRFWGQLVRWAIAADLGAGSQSVRIRTDKSHYNTREIVQLTVRLTDTNGESVVTDGVAVKITGGDESIIVSMAANLEAPGEYRGDIRALPPGAYRAEPIGAAVEHLQQDNSHESSIVSFSVQKELSPEFIETRCDRAMAQHIADITGGQVIPPTAVDEIIKLTNLEPITSETIQEQPLWLQWKYLWIVFGSLHVEWFIRRRLGLS